MGNQFSNSSAVRSFTHLNNASTSEGCLSTITKLRMAAAGKLGGGVSVNCFGGLLMIPDARLILLIPAFVIPYNAIDISKMNADNMANTINHRHGYENFEGMSAADKSRVKSYVRSEMRYGGMLREGQRFSPEERVGFPGNAAMLADA